MNIFKNSHPIIATLICINIFIFLAPRVVSWLFGLLFLESFLQTPLQPIFIYNLDKLFIFFGGVRRTFILDDSQYYRLLTAVFLHASFIHLLVNMISLNNIGNTILQIYNSKKFLVIYFFSGILASLFSVFFSSPESYSVGASGCIFGLFGAFCAWAILTRQARYLKLILINLLLNLYIGFTYPQIDNWAHLGGFLAGISLGFTYLYHNRDALAQKQV